jgi:hypothetical protein
MVMVDVVLSANGLVGDGTEQAVSNAQMIQQQTSSGRR